VFFILFFTEEIFTSIGLKPALAVHAGNFCKGLTPGLWFFYQCDAIRRFLQAQGIYIPTIGVVLFTSLLHPLWLYIFFVVLDWGAFGNGLASSVTNILNFILVFLLAKYLSKNETYFCINADAFRGWKDFLAVAIPSLFMICLENWNYQITAIMVGYIEKEGEECQSCKDQVGGNIILLNMGLFFYMFPFGMSVASSNLVGKFVGRYSVKATEMSCRFSILFTLICSAFIMGLLAIFRPWIPYIYTDVESKAEVVKTLIIYYIFYEFFDFLTTSYAGMFRGLGMQTIISWANFICFYIISIPLCYVLTYSADWGIYGNWSSYIVAIILLVALYSFIYLKKVDFQQICYESKRRLSRDTMLLKSQIDPESRSQEIDI